MQIAHRFTKYVLAALALIGAFSVQQASATAWNWSYSGSGVTAGGSLLTSDAPDADGYYQILSIAGNRNGDSIVDLYPARSAIPGNEPYAIDNLIRISGSDQITLEGFGYSLASGAHANPFFADFLSPPTYSEVFTQGSTFSEQPISFNAAPVPEPSAIALVVSGLIAVAFSRLASRRGA